MKRRSCAGNRMKSTVERKRPDNKHGMRPTRFRICESGASLRKIKFQRVGRGREGRGAALVGTALRAVRERTETTRTNGRLGDASLPQATCSELGDHFLLVAWFEQQRTQSGAFDLVVLVELEANRRGGFRCFPTPFADRNELERNAFFPLRPAASPRMKSRLPIPMYDVAIRRVAPSEEIMRSTISCAGHRCVV